MDTGERLFVTMAVDEDDSPSYHEALRFHDCRHGRFKT